QNRRKHRITESPGHAVSFAMLRYRRTRAKAGEKNAKGHYGRSAATRLMFRFEWPKTYRFCHRL
ncbi:MAG: hypothetical protein R6U98_18155, partial [Pirellulaceae bacterium]